MEELDKLTEWLDSPAGQKHLNEYAEKIEREQVIKDNQLLKFHLKIGSDILKFTDFVEKVILKYDSKQYSDRWYSRGIMPPEDLYFFLFYYAEKYGRVCEDENELKEYGNMFTTSLCYVNGYYFNWMNGQGSVVLIEREK